jgi:hypothetical protein
MSSLSESSSKLLLTVIYFPMYTLLWSRANALDDQGSILNRGKTFFCTSQHPNRFWDLAIFQPYEPQGGGS